MTCGILLLLMVMASPGATDTPSAVPKASVVVDTAAKSTPYSRMIFGGFIEHFDRQIYGGLFEPGSPLSDRRGFRQDVIEALKELRLSVVRWPGGCFASGYHWRDGVVPAKAQLAVKQGVVKLPSHSLTILKVRPN